MRSFEHTSVAGGVDSGGSLSDLQRMMASIGNGKSKPTESVGSSIDGMKSGVKGTGYYPPPPEGYASKEEEDMEGGPKDRIGRPLATLQAYLRGEVDYVSVAMDETIENGIRFTSQELNEQYASQYPDRVPIVLEMCDTGDAFKGAGWDKMDICVDNESESLDPVINGSHTLEPIDSLPTQGYFV